MVENEHFLFECETNCKRFYYKMKLEKLILNNRKGEKNEKIINSIIIYAYVIFPSSL